MSANFVTHVDRHGDGVRITRVLGEKKYKHPPKVFEIDLGPEEFLEFAEAVSEAANAMVGGDLP